MGNWLKVKAISSICKKSIEQNLHHQNEENQAVKVSPGGSSRGGEGGEGAKEGWRGQGGRRGEGGWGGQREANSVCTRF